jgi:predicted Zn-dependent peptidase
MFKKITLKNGLRVVCEKIPYVKSVSIGVWIGTGSRNENINNNGISHFVEHMLFKGTNKRTAKEIAESIDNIGGQINAFTGKECTCFYTRTLDSHIDIAMDVLADMIFNSTFNEKDIALEKKVVLEEIGMYEDTPEELVLDILSDITWKNDTLSYPILGTSKTVKRFNRQMIADYMDSAYTADNAVISIAGNFDIQKVNQLVEAYFGSWKKGPGREIYPKSNFISNVKIKQKDIEQVHLCMGLEGIEHGNEDLYSLLAINSIFGGGMSSRLFQKVREEKGLVYSIYSYPTSYKNTGLFSIYAGMNPSKLEQVIHLIVQEMKTLSKKDLTEHEILKAKEQLKGSYILGLESTSGRMNSIGKSELILDRIYSPEEILKKIDSISKNSIYHVIDAIFNNKQMSVSAVGNVSKSIDIKALLNE